MKRAVLFLASIHPEEAHLGSSPQHLAPSFRPGLASVIRRPYPGYLAGEATASFVATRGERAPVMQRYLQHSRTVGEALGAPETAARDARAPWQLHGRKGAGEALLIGGIPPTEEKRTRTHWHHRLDRATVSVDATVPSRRPPPRPRSPTRSTCST